MHYDKNINKTKDPPLTLLLNVLNKYFWFDLISILQTDTMERAFSKVHHRCFSPHKKLRPVFNDVNLPLKMSCNRQIYVCIKKEESSDALIPALLAWLRSSI